jgi:small-conductance mechanosensitive channel
MAQEEDWQTVFLSEPDVQGVESMTREETVIRLVAKVRPLEQWRTARELRRRIREQFDNLDIDAHLPPEGAHPRRGPEAEAEAQADARAEVVADAKENPPA